MFARIYDCLERISRVAVWVGGAALLLAAIMVTLDVLSRKILGVTMSGSDEITGYVFAASTSWAYSYCLLNRANIRIDAVYGLFPRSVQAALDVIGTLLLLVFMGVLTERAIFTLKNSIEYESVSVTTLTTPLWVPQLFWVSGLVLLMVTLVFISIFSLTALFQGDFRTVTRVVGIKSREEEIEEEARNAGAMTGEREY